MAQEYEITSDWRSYVGGYIDGDVHTDTIKNLTTPMTRTPIERYVSLLGQIVDLLPETDDPNRLI